MCFPWKQAQEDTAYVQLIFYFFLWFLVTFLYIFHENSFLDVYYVFKGFLQHLQR